MNKILSFLTGSFCGALVGATVVLLTTPASGHQLRADARARVELALAEAQQAMDDTRHQKELEFEMMKQGQVVE